LSRGTPMALLEVGLTLALIFGFFYWVLAFTEIGRTILVFVVIFGGVLVNVGM
jgi:hypothetical protein